MASAARTAAACRIARLDRQKFNDLMASGEYTCAPRTTAGVPRVFEKPDLIGLYIFARLTEKSWTVRQASDVVCQIVSKLRDAAMNDRELPEPVAIANSELGTTFTAEGKDVNPYASHFGGGGKAHEILYTEFWNITNVLRSVDQGLAEENRIVGED